MKLVFIDEIKGGGRHANLYGLCFVMLDIYSYNAMSRDFIAMLGKHGWDPEIEYKGRYLFAREPADQRLDTQQMIELTRDLLGGLFSSNNSRAKIVFVWKDTSADEIDDFSQLLAEGVKRLPRADSEVAGKNLVACYFDAFDQGCKKNNLEKLGKVANEAFAKRNWNLIESSICPVISSNESVGTIYADVMAYVSKWVAENPEDDEIDYSEILGTRTEEKINVVRSIRDQFGNNLKVERIDG